MQSQGLNSEKFRVAAVSAESEPDAGHAGAGRFLQCDSGLLPIASASPVFHVPKKDLVMQAELKDIPKLRSNLARIRHLPEAVLDRRATVQFKPDPVAEEHLNDILRLASQAPSGYNLQPWRFIVVRDEENRKRLQKVAMNQAKVAQAPVVVIAIGMKDEPIEMAEEILRQGAERGAGQLEQVKATAEQARGFLSSGIRMDVWVNRHVMIAVTTMMLAAEVFGYDTAPMEGFDPEGVKREFGLPTESEVVCLLAIGKVKEPDKPYPGRLGLDRIVYSERYGEAWTGDSAATPAEHRAEVTMGR
jgi:nitroreductase